MAKLKLTYFDFDGGRGETARVALFVGGVPFEDRRIGVKDWPTFRGETPFLAMPVLEVDDKPVTQSNSINRYVGKLSGLYPKDDLLALVCDEVMDACEDIGTRLGNTIGLPDDQKQKAREGLAGELLPRYLEQLQSRLQTAGGAYFVDGRLTVADLKVFGLVRWLRSGALDHIAKDIVERHAPQLVEHFERVASDPKVADYYARRRA